MIDAASTLQVRRRLSWLLLATLAVWACHRVTGIFAARGLRPLARGYADDELLAPGGDLALELVLLHEQALLEALTALGLVLVLGRAMSSVVAFFSYRAGFLLAWGSPEHVRTAESKALHTAWAIPAVLGVTLVENLLLAAVVVGLGRLARSFEATSPETWTVSFAFVGLVVGSIWTLAEAWLDLYRLALAGARLGPLAAARRAGQAWARNWGRLALGRGAVGLGTVLVAAGGVLVLPAITRGTTEQRTWGTLAIDLGVLGMLCVRAGWLVWASGHFAPAAKEELKPGSSEDALPAAAPDEPADPSPGPGA